MLKTTPQDNMNRLLTYFTVLLVSFGCTSEPEDSNTTYYQLKVIFPEGNGLRSNTLVSYEGREIGKITSLEVDETGKVMTSIEFKDSIKIPLKSKFLITSDFLDTKSIEVLYSREERFYLTGTTVYGKVSTNGEMFDTSSSAQKLLDSLKQYSDSVLHQL